MKRKPVYALIALAVLAAGASPAQNRQPVSTSLTECSVIYAEAASLGARRGDTEESQAALADLSTLFATAAVTEAQREGMADPQAHIATERDRLAEKWQGRLSRITLLLENKNWIDYCRALGQARGVIGP